MGVRRVMGIETEYGISVPGDPLANPMIRSGHVVHAYAAGAGAHAVQAGWDYTDEAPLVDARGFDLPRRLADPSQLTDTDDPTLANVVLTNGARLYVDHAHPEYSSPEVMSPRAAVVWDRAGEEIMRQAVERLSMLPPGVNLYKNNTDGKGASYGTHENYLMSRSTPFMRIVRDLTGFFVARQVMSGAGRVGLGQESRRAGFQLAQRSDFFEAEVGLETTLRRPIINTRDEPHAVADRYRRLHVIIGDANHCDVANLLKLGSTSLVLAMIEADAAPQVEVEEPVRSLREISHDPTLRHRVRLRDGRMVTGLDIASIYFEAACAFVERTQGTADHDTAQVLHWWEYVLTGLASDPMSMGRVVDWVAKLEVLNKYRDREHLAWDHAKLRAIDIQWSDVRLERGIFHRLAASGRFEELVTRAEVLAAVTDPPEDTRAYFRGTCLKRFPESVAAASWDSVIFDLPGGDTRARVATKEPQRGTRASVGEILDQVDGVEELLQKLSGVTG